LNLQTKQLAIMRQQGPWQAIFGKHSPSKERNSFRSNNVGYGTAKAAQQLYWRPFIGAELVGRQEYCPTPNETSNRGHVMIWEGRMAER